jgi:hypothetical protein
MRKRNKTLYETRVGKFKDQIYRVLLKDVSFTARLLGLVNTVKGVSRKEGKPYMIKISDPRVERTNAALPKISPK